MDNDPLNNDKTVDEPLGDKPGAGSGELSAGTILGQYRIICLLGRGGMGEVYEVEHEVLRRRYALKFIPDELVNQKGFLERFKREAQVMANLEHSHIVKVDEFGETQGRYWLRMELVEGVKGEGKRIATLAELAESAGGKVEQNLLASILFQVLDSLSYAHKKGAVHRDLKPANILLSGNDISSLEAKISDFGLVRLVGEEWVRSKAERSVSLTMSMGDKLTEPDPEKSGTSTRSLLGTYEYMSPEQKRGEQADERSDIYAVGLMIHRLLTGQRELSYELPSQVDEKLLKEWDSFVAKAVKSEGSRRYVSVDEMLKSLKKVKEALDAGLETERQEEAGRAAERKSKEAEEKRKQEERRRREEEKVRQTEERKKAEAVKAEKRGRRSRGRRLRKVIAGVAIIVIGIVGYSFFQSVSELRRVEKPQKEITNSIGMKLVLIPAGEFMMGSPSSEGKRDSDEGPRHRVKITKLFYLGKYEVTQSEYEAVMGKNPSYFKGANNPVENVSWNDAVKFCKMLSEKEGVTYRLPTEAEWEYACRADSSTAYCFGDGEGGLGEYGWYRSNSGSKTHAVGEKKPNAWGLYNMHGNVWEWCGDWYDSSYYSKSPVNDPKGPGSGSSRVLRGGCWGVIAYYCRSANRYWSFPSNSRDNGGFRCVRSSAL